MGRGASTVCAGHTDAQTHVGPVWSALHPLMPVAAVRYVVLDPLLAFNGSDAVHFMNGVKHFVV